MKILINTPSLYLSGGVANHYLGLKAYWKEHIKYNTVGKRNSKSSSGIYWLLWDILKFIFRLITFRPQLVLVNPSLGKSALKRDFLFLSIAQRLNFKTAIFIHGFDLDYAKQVDKQWVTDHLNRTKLIFVLAKAFKEELVSWGVKTPITLTTTKVSDQIVQDFNIGNRTGEIKNLLFLSRIEKAKGVYEAIDTYKLLKTSYPHLTLSIVGDGGELKAVKEYINSQSITDIRLTGNLSGQVLMEEFKKGDIYLFPSYGEGMPTSVLEAMAFGMPVITRYVGGLADFFEDNKMGYITNSLIPEDFAHSIIRFIDTPELTKQVSRYNHEYAKEHFMASIVARQMEGEFSRLNPFIPK